LLTFKGEYIRDESQTVEAIGFHHFATVILQDQGTMVPRALATLIAYSGPILCYMTFANGKWFAPVDTTLSDQPQNFGVGSWILHNLNLFALAGNFGGPYVFGVSHDNIYDKVFGYTGPGDRVLPWGHEGLNGSYINWKE
jgi:hypothetical protein